MLRKRDIEEITKEEDPIVSKATEDWHKGKTAPPEVFDKLLELNKEKTDWLNSVKQQKLKPVE